MTVSYTHLDVYKRQNPLYLVLAVLLWGGMYWVSKQFCKKHNLE